MNIELDPKFSKLFNGLFNRFTHKQYYDLFPDVTPTLEFLKKNGFQTGVISNTDERISNVPLSPLPLFFLTFCIICRSYTQELTIR